LVGVPVSVPSRKKNPLRLAASRFDIIKGALLSNGMLILASASPRRHELLVAAGLDHVIAPAHVPEVQAEDEAAEDFVIRLAVEKATAILRTGKDVVLGADTAVCVDSEIFGKPADMTDAERMIRALAGRTHLVHTGICLRSENRAITDLATTEVEFSPLSDSEIEEYTRSGEGMDKAGGYGIQGLASRFVTSIRGSYQNVVGLPVSLVYQHLKSLSHDL
jgi:septum formation protein